VVDGKEEKAIEVVWVTKGMDHCRVGFLPRHTVRHAARYNDRTDCDSRECRAYHIS
jgi:hypothetical protein